MSLFDVFSLAYENRLVDFPAVQAHQRPLVVTVFAIMMHTLQRYADGVLESSESWAAAWDLQIGESAMRLTAPHDEVAFLQPPTVEPKTTLSREGTDCLLPAVQHEVKETYSASAEEWLFSLIGGLARPIVNYNRPSSRVGFTCVLTSWDGTIGSEILTLAKAYSALEFPPGKSAADHMIWLRRFDPDTKPLLVTDLPRPFIDMGRPVRLVADGGHLVARSVPSNAYRIEKPEQWIDDPQAPQFVGKSVSRFGLKSKAWDYRLQHQVLFGGERQDGQVVRPRILDLVEYRFVRLCALGTAQGKTLGYREAFYTARRTAGGFRLAPPSSEDRAAELSKRALDTLQLGSGQLAAAMLRLLKLSSFNELSNRPRENAIVETLRSDFTAGAGPATVQLILDFLNAEPDAEVEQQSLNTAVASRLWDTFVSARLLQTDYLGAADAEGYMRWAISHHFSENAIMSETDSTPPLARQTYAVLNEIVAHLTPNDRATLRTMDMIRPPMLFWMLVAAAPQRQTEHAVCLAVWKSVLRAAGRSNLTSRGLGRVLAETEYPQDRMGRMLNASGTVLLSLTDEVSRWLVSHEVEQANLAELATLGLADALSDTGAREWIRRKIALDYAREFRREAADSAAA